MQSRLIANYSTKKIVSKTSLGDQIRIYYFDIFFTLIFFSDRGPYSQGDFQRARIVL